MVLFDWNGREHWEADIIRWTKVSLSSTGMLRLYGILSRVDGGFSNRGNLKRFVQDGLGE